MAAQIPSRSGRVLELGPGTGVVTNAILARGIAPSQLTVIEYDPQFARVIAERFPGINVVQADAFQLSRVLGETEKFHAIVSSLPLLNFAATMREALIAEIFARLAADAPFIQFSYGLNPPVPAPKGGSVMRVAHVILNLPPARVWVYRKPHS
jgi:phosphatidylethanolamine/phosphatidyl-N-methylethanolamine N-methyltransferase